MLRRFLLPIFLALGSTALTVLACEGGLRLLRRPGVGGAITLFGTYLPPFKLIPDDYVPYQPVQATAPVVVAGRLISAADLSGVFREDILVGYVPRESAVSQDGWWQSNELGARHRGPVSRAVTSGQRRILVFGESYAGGSRMPQEEIWTEDLTRVAPNLEVVNFGVDGYSMGQSYLRFVQVRDRIDWDVAVLLFVPTEDTWRDVNVMRRLLGWHTYLVLPRFALVGDRLTLVRSPYRDLAQVLAANRPRVSPLLHRHLLAYDRFYRPRLYAAGSFANHSLLYRLWVAYREPRVIEGLVRRELDPGAEAVRVSEAIFGRMEAEVRARGKRFVLVVLPTERDLRRYHDDPGYRRLWAGTAEAVCARLAECVDLMPPMNDAPADSLDLGYGGNHYGPRASRLIARLLVSRLAMPPREPPPASVGSARPPAPPARRHSRD